MKAEDKKYRTVKYHQHGILRKVFNYKTHIQSWVFEGPHETKGYKGDEFELIGLLDELSKNGYELVCSSDEDYIVRTINEIEEIEEYQDDVDLSK